MKEDSFKIRGTIAHVEKSEVVRIEDTEGREYIWDGTELYRLKPLKG